jgi:dihydropteroate synthase
LRPALWRLRSRTLDLEAGTIVMGVLNVTPDSFSDGSAAALDPEAAVRRGLALAAHGAAIVDVGGESTRPYATPVATEEELARVVPVVEGLVAAGVIVSIDTMKPAVAQAALDAGAEIVNDVSGFRDPDMIALAADTDAGLVVMHMQGTPQTMQDDPVYEDVVAEVGAHLDEQASRLVAAGVRQGSIAVDPGIGFGKTRSHNLSLLRHLDRIADRPQPVLIGVSRKGFIGSVLTDRGLDTTPAERDLASAVVAGIAVRAGAAIVRAHDARATVEAVTLADAIVRPAGGSQRSGDT